MSKVAEVVLTEAKKINDLKVLGGIQIVIEHGTEEKANRQTVHIRVTEKDDAESLATLLEEKASQLRSWGQPHTHV